MMRFFNRRYYEEKVYDNPPEHDARKEWKYRWT
jgi:hypothetical protein